MSTPGRGVFTVGRVGGRVGVGTITEWILGRMKDLKKRKKKKKANRKDVERSEKLIHYHPIKEIFLTF